MARRPVDRKAQIARASAEAFSALGYHGVTMGTIALRVGISAPALYRHYPGRYALFRNAVLSLSRQLVDATDFADGSDEGDEGDDPGAALRSIVAALIDTSLTNRNSGGLYRWQARYLRADDQATLTRQMNTVHHRIQRPLARLRPDLTSRQHWTMSTSVLSVIGSVVDHRAKLPSARIKAVLAELATAIVTADLTGVRENAVTHVPARRPPASNYEALLDESMRQFNEKGYRDTSVDDIASAVGMPASGVYRYFSRKSDLLAAAFQRAADWLSAELVTITMAAATADEALATAIDSYVARSFERPEFDYVYYTERLNLPAADQNVLRSMERATVESWTHLVTAVRPDLTTGEARFVVHAALALVIDVGRLTGYQNSAQTREMVCGLMDLALLGRYRLRIALPAR